MAKDKKELYDFCSRRQKSLEQLKEGVTASFEEISSFIIPAREDVRGEMKNGEKKGRKIYDGTATNASLVFANGMFGYMLSPGMIWWRARTGNREIDDLPIAKQWFEDLEHHIYSVMNKSNFYESIWMYLYDGGTLATSTMYLEEDPFNGNTLYECVHPGEVYIADNQFGRVDIVHRKRKVSVRKIRQKFNLPGDVLPREVKDAKDEFHELEVVHCVYPRVEYQQNSLASEKKQYASVWYIGSDIVRVSGFDEFPYAVWRYMKTGKDPYGFGPGHFALSDVRGLNIMEKTTLGAAQLAIDGMWNVPTDLRDKIGIHPGAQFPYDDPNMIVRPVGKNSDFRLSLEEKQRKEESIKEHFHVPFFLYLSSLTNAGKMTATEIMERSGERSVVLGAATNRLNTEALDKIISWTISNELRMGRAPQPPDELVDIAGGLPIELMYVGPLMMQQRRMFETDGIRNGLAEALPIFEVYPEAKVAVKPIETARKLLNARNFPQDCLSTDEEIEAFREAQEAAMQQQQMGQDLLDASQGIKQLTEADKNTGGELGRQLAGAL